MKNMKWAILALMIFSVFLGSWSDPLLIEVLVGEKGFAISMNEEDERAPFLGESHLGRLIGFHVLPHLQRWVPSSSMGPSTHPLFLKFRLLRC
jgi:hypothetical protein